MADLFADQELPAARGGARDRRAARRPAAPEVARRGRRPGASDRPRGRDRADGRGGPAASMILWGPPGTGKTSIARLLADAVGLALRRRSRRSSRESPTSRRSSPRRGPRRARGRRLCCSWTRSIASTGRSRTASALVEDGTVTLVGATTQNPSFEINAALLSRCQVLILRRLDHDALEELVR